MYIDLLRIIAAVAVLLGHAHGFVIPSLPWTIAGNAGDAVAVFFVLSGFVIAYVAQDREKDWKQYSVARLSRVYSVCILALIVTFTCDAIGHAHNPRVYGLLTFYSPETISSAFQDAFFLNELWLNHSVFGTNEPYWSLSFEVWYYVFFGLIYFLPRPFKYPAVIVWALLCGPKIVLYLPLWLMGYFTYRCLPRVSSLQWSKRAMWVAYVGGIAIYFVMHRLFQRYVPGSPMFEMQRAVPVMCSFIYSMLLGAIVSSNILLFAALTRDSSFWSASYEKLIRWCAGATFTLYLVHQPMLIMIAAIAPGVRLTPVRGLAAILVVIVATLVLAELGERRKRMLSRRLSAWFS